MAHFLIKWLSCRAEGKDKYGEVFAGGEFARNHPSELCNDTLWLYIHFLFWKEMACRNCSNTMAGDFRQQCTDFAVFKQIRAEHFQTYEKEIFHLRRQYSYATFPPSPSPLLDLFTWSFIDVETELLIRTRSIKAETHWKRVSCASTKCDALPTSNFDF